MTEWQIALEIVLVGLLATMLFYMMRLERALSIVRRDRTELERLLNDFNESTQHAENGVVELRKVADGIGKETNRQCEVARLLQGDLTQLIERGNAVANRLDDLVRQDARPELYSSQRSVADPVVVDRDTSRVRSQAERDLLRALRVPR